jgi:acetolactate synthase I/II/III large subunit
MARVADFVAGWIADAGVRDVFLLPGGGAMYLNDGVACEPRLNSVPCHHEQACGIAAEAYGRVSTAGFGVAMVTTGPGATNVLTPVAGAWIESLPLMIIAGQVKRADALNGRPLRQGGVQEVDVLEMVKPVTKYAARVDDPKQIKKVLEEARHAMLDGRPGPVWVDVPLDVQAAQVNDAQLEGFAAPDATIAVVDSADLEQLNRLLESSKRPLILAGHGVRISGGAEIFSQMVERLGIPCVFTWNASDLLPWDHNQYVGRPGVVAARAPNLAVQNCDLLIAIGARLDNIVTAYNSEQFARGAKKVVIDVDQNELDKHQFSAALSICSNARDFLRAWFEVLPLTSPSWNSWVERCHHWKQHYLPGDRLAGTPASQPVTHIEFVEKLSELIPPDRLIVTGSSGLAVEFFYTAFRNKADQRFFLTSGLGAMGYGLPAAIGACVGSGRQPTFCIESDGSLMLNLQELATLKTLNLPIAIIVMNNQGYASIRNTQRNYFASRYIGSEQGSCLEIPDLANIARTFGIQSMSGDRLTDLSDFVLGLEFSAPKLLDFRLVADEALSPKVSALPQADGSILSMPLEDMSPLLPLEVMQKEMLIPLLPQSKAARAKK